MGNMQKVLLGPGIFPLDLSPKDRMSDPIEFTEEPPETAWTGLFPETPTPV